MYGGTLSTSGIVIIEQLDLLIAAYSHQLYFFGLGEATIKRTTAYHQASILCMYYNPKNRVLTSIDQQGYAAMSTVNQQGVWNYVRTQKLFQGCQLKEAKILSDKQGQISIYAIELNGKLLRYSEGLVGKVTENCSKILYYSRQLLVVRQEYQRVSVIDGISLRQKFEYCHTCELTSAQVYQSNLVLGDVRGKINLLKGFLESGEVQLKQKLQWHVHEVSFLKIHEAFLYSGGQEGVVVLWHLRENRKDFLPRIGAKIVNIIVRDSKIYCILADNTIKSIDLSNDKSLVQFKTVISTGAELINSSSSSRAKDPLIRVSSLGDKIYLRSLPGRLQSIHLSGGLNTEYNIVNRNNISRLDKHLPNPHQITDVTFSHDNSQMVASIQGYNCRSLKFYIFDQQDFKLVSKVQNCHKGEDKINLLTMGDRFISYSKSDNAIKVWKRMSHRKESLIQVEQHYWGCEYEISYKEKLPIYVSSQFQRITAVYEGQFTIFNTKSKTIQASYILQKKQKQILAIFQVDSSDSTTFLLIFAKLIELVNLRAKKASTEILLDLSKQNYFISESKIYFNQKKQSFAALINGFDSQKIFIHHFHAKGELLQIQSKEQSSLSQLFWVGERLIAFDSQLLFHDLTHQQQLINLSQKNEERRDNEIQEQMQEEETGLASSYDLLYSKYLERQYKRDRATIDKNNQIISLTPSITASFQLFASQLFL